MSPQEMEDTSKRSDQLGRAANFQDVEGEDTHFYDGSSRSCMKLCLVMSQCWTLIRVQSNRKAFSWGLSLNNFMILLSLVITHMG